MWQQVDSYMTSSPKLDFQRSELLYAAIFTTIYVTLLLETHLISLSHIFFAKLFCWEIKMKTPYGEPSLYWI